jgi:hypothetical protein
VGRLCKEAARRSVEFEAVRGRYNQKGVDSRGCIRNGSGRRAMPERVKQLTEWFEPVSVEELVSFLP